MMNFNDLNISDDIKKAIDEMGFTKLTPIQKTSIPKALEGVDIMGQAQTGSGKTIAFAIPILSKVFIPDRSPQTIVLCPTRELCMQVASEISKVGVHIKKLKVLAVYGGQPIGKQTRVLKKGVHIVVGTPGRVIDHIERGNLDLIGIETVVLDEADEMLDMGFKEDIETILANVRIEASFYDSSRGRYNLLGSSIGSGVIIKSEVVRNKLYYYALTNNHVIYNNYSYANYIVEDVYENEYQGTLIYSLNTYDLALVRFEAKEELYVIDLADSDIISGYVASIGEANAKSNTLTYGYVSGYEAFTPNEDEINLSNVTFSVLTHTSYIEPGSSGGALLNMKLKLVGINFASKIDEDENWEYSYAIPASKINEFLDICYEKTGFSQI